MALARRLTAQAKLQRQACQAITRDGLEVMQASFPVLSESELLVTTEQMLAALADPTIKLLDNRDKDEWLGESSSPYGKDFAPRKGRIPGSVWLEWYELMDTRACCRFTWATIGRGRPWPPRSRNFS
ncbi:hypothetical protein [Burkholderia cenocepacia]